MSIKSLRFRLFKRDPEGGQVLPLAAASLLVAALMVFISLNVAYAVHERIRLQNYVDTKAYAEAVEEARSFNYFAYTNRAIANAYVSMATLNAEMSEAAMVSGGELWLAIDFLIIALTELGEALASLAEWDFGDAAEHFEHMALAFVNMGEYFSKNNDYQDTVKKLDKPYQSAMDALSTHVGWLFKSEEETALALGAWLVLDTGVDALKSNGNLGTAAVNDTTASGLALGAKTVLQYKSALNYSTNDTTKQEEINNVINASRSKFTWNRGGFGWRLVVDNLILLPALKTWYDDCDQDKNQIEPFYYIIPLEGESGFGKLSIKDTNNNDQSVDSKDFALMPFFKWHDGFSLPFPIEGKMYTAKSGSDHSAIPGNPHDTDHNKDNFDTSRFMEFAISTTAKGSFARGPYGQPYVYAAGSRDLSSNNDASVRAPWEITNDVNGIQVGVGGDVGKLALADRADSPTTSGGTRGTGLAVSKAMTYYHRFGDWKEAPNFFNPYWRAKMESFDSATELDTLLALAVAAKGSSTAAKLFVAGQELGNSGSVNIKQ